MPVPTVMSDLSTTAAINSPAVGDSMTTLDDHLRATQAILRTTNAKGSDIASASTTDIGAATGEFVDVTGTTTITALGTTPSGIVRVVRFTGILTLTYNASSLILPGAANIVTAAGDVAVFRSLGSGNWVCTDYMPAGTAPALTSALTSGSFSAPLNLSLAASVSANALTVALKTASGSDASGANPVVIPYRSPTAATGTFALRRVIAANSIVVPSGATLGAVSGQAFRIWVLWLDDGTNSGLAVYNALHPTALHVLPISASITGASATAIGTGSDSSQTIYVSSTPTSAFSMRVLGYLNFESGLTTAGTWDAGPTKIQLFGPDVPLPGATVQTRYNFDGTVGTGTTTMPADATIPQITEGVQFLTLAITPFSAANILKIKHAGEYSHNTGAANLISTALFQDATANALAATVASVASGDLIVNEIEHTMLAATTSATTLRIRTGCNSAATTVFNGGASGGTVFNGVMASHLAIEEIQG